MLSRETIIECYLFNAPHVVAGMLYDTITRYESFKSGTGCEGCIYENKSADWGACEGCSRNYPDNYKPKDKNV